MGEITYIHIYIKEVHNIPNGATIITSAPVICAPHRNPPPDGAEASWDSRKSHCRRRLGFRNIFSTAPVMRRAKGRRKKGVEVLMPGVGGCEDFFLSFFLYKKVDQREREGKKERTIQQQPNHQIRHHAPLGIMHEIPVPDPGLRLPAHPAFGGALRVPRRRELRSEILDQVFDDRARFGEDQGLWGVRGLDAQDGEFAQRVHVLEGAGRETVFALVGFEGVGEVEVFEEEEDALGAGLGEPVFGGGGETRR